MTARIIFDQVKSNSARDSMVAVVLYRTILLPILIYLNLPGSSVISIIEMRQSTDNCARFLIRLSRNRSWEDSRRQADEVKGRCQMSLFEEK